MPEITARRQENDEARDPVAGEDANCGAHDMVGGLDDREGEEIERGGPCQRDAIATADDHVEPDGNRQTAGGQHEQGEPQRTLQHRRVVVGGILVPGSQDEDLLAEGGDDPEEPDARKEDRIDAEIRLAQAARGKRDQQEIQRHHRRLEDEDAEYPAISRLAKEGDGPCPERIAGHRAVTLSFFGGFLGAVHRSPSDRGIDVEAWPTFDTRSRRASASSPMRAPSLLRAR